MKKFKELIRLKFKARLLMARSLLILKYKISLLMARFEKVIGVSN